MVTSFNSFTARPSKYLATQDDINQALDDVVSDLERKRIVEQELREEPRTLIKKLFQLSAEQRASMKGMTDDDLKAFVSPIINALDSGREFIIEYNQVPQAVAAQINDSDDSNARAARVDISFSTVIIVRF